MRGSSRARHRPAFSVGDGGHPSAGSGKLGSKGPQLAAAAQPGFQSSVPQTLPHGLGVGYPFRPRGR
eukprot:3124708-Lingulodinium_polyedra.AAC.1